MKIRKTYNLTRKPLDKTKELIFMMRNNMEKERKTSTRILVSQKLFVLKIETTKAGN
ncbi:hypothetical protein R3W88_019361 [Solanum pinnatisectum]|uniref:Uncharacterized protein n=1 Tax=Solanum pinnatisectum TaxID=50273 RepID=A0AAV9KJF9_9SOLN|nr:hypothetical protein R3W88_019361 [Solanum pinnatisectum]